MPSESRPAKNENSIADVPRWSDLIAATLVVTLLVMSSRFVTFANIRSIHMASIDQLNSARNGRGGDVQSCFVFAIGTIGALLVNVACSIDQDGVCDRDKAVCSISRLADVPTNLEVCIWQVNPAGNFPIRVVALRNVNASGQFWVLVNCHARK